MAKLIAFMVIVTLSLAFEFCASESLNNCPNDPDVMVGDVIVKKDGSLLAHQKETVRIPTNGVLENKISCILISDNSGEGGIPQITNGGIEFLFVEVQLISQLSKGLDYELLVYTEKPTTTAADTSTTKK